MEQFVDTVSEFMVEHGFHRVATFRMEFGFYVAL